MHSGLAGYSDSGVGDDPVSWLGWPHRAAYRPVAPGRIGQQRVVKRVTVFDVVSITVNELGTIFRVRVAVLTATA